LPINQKNGTFRDVAVDSEVADNSDGVAQPALLFPMTAKKFSDICETKPVLHSDPVRLYGFYAP